MTRGSPAAALRAAAERPAARHLLPRAALAVAVLSLLSALLSDRLTAIRADDVLAALAGLRPAAVAGAAICAAASFIAIAYYDHVALRLLGLAVPLRQSLKTGFAATAISQATGFGPVVGAMVRWRFYRRAGLRPAEATRCALVVSGAFVLCLAMLLPVAMLLAPGVVASALDLSPARLRLFAWAGLGADAAVLALCLWRPHLVLAGRAVQPPKLRGLLRFLLLALCDVIPAAGILWLLLPPGCGIGYLALLPLYMGALGLGLATNAPGGIGVLEASCFLALPSLPPAGLMAALLAYRALYHGLPLILGAGLLAAEEARHGRAARSAPNGRPPHHRPAGPGDLPPAARAVLSTSPAADAGLAWLGDKDLLFTPGRAGFVMCAEAGNALVALSDPVGPRRHWPALTDRFAAEAEHRLLAPAIYKARPDYAAFLADRGWYVARQGMEAVVDARSFTLDGPDRRGLRRKLAQAGRAGVTIASHAPGRAPMAGLAAVTDAWLADKQGAEKGFSMGHADPAYRDRFDILTAGNAGGVLGFLSLWRSGDGGEWSLDLIRLRPGAPAGTMHALVAAAIAQAAGAGAARFSLCAVPFAGLEAPRGPLRAFRRLALASPRRPVGPARPAPLQVRLPPGLGAALFRQPRPAAGLGHPRRPAPGRLTREFTVWKYPGGVAIGPAPMAGGSAPLPPLRPRRTPGRRSCPRAWCGSRGRTSPRSAPGSAPP